MKILEEETWWVFRCKNCGSKLQAEPVDVQKDHPDHDAYSDGNPRYYVKCVKCGERKTVPDNKLTAQITAAANRRAR